MSSSKIASYPHYPRDYAMDTQLLTLEEHGAYRLLLDYQWLHGAVPSPADLARLWGISPSKAKRLWAALAPYFPEDEPGKPLNRRLERERVACTERIEQSRSAAKLRWKRAGAHADASPDAPPTADAGGYASRAGSASVSVSVSEGRTAVVPSHSPPSDAGAARRRGSHEPVRPDFAAALEPLRRVNAENRAREDASLDARVLRPLP